LGLRAGKLFAWGQGFQGQLGQGNQTYYSSPVQVGSETDWTMIATGEYHSYGIRAGKLFAWGDNNVGQLGLGNITNRLSPVQVGSLSDWKSIAGGLDWALAVR